MLSVVKGIEEGTHLRMTEVIGQELPGRRLAALSGPNLAREIAAGKPAGSVVASDDAELAVEFASVLSAIGSGSTPTATLSASSWPAR